MIINRLELKNFRNYEQEVFENFSPNVNLICAKNAQGKTNMMEAIFYTACGKSFKNTPEQKLIRRESDFAYIRVDFANRNVGSKLECRLYDGKKKSILVGGVPITKISELLGVINSVVFAPEDMRTIKEAPSLRRRFIDIEISKLSPAYYGELQKYNIALKNKNILLKNPNSKDGVISAFNETMAGSAEKIIRSRQKYVDKMKGQAKSLHTLICGANEVLDIEYRLTAHCDGIFEKFEKNMKKEREAGCALIGPHRDDLMITLDGFDTKLYSSQGQQRTAMLSLKLSAGLVAKEYCGEYPVLLLDDVFSELDESRRNALLTCSRGMQVFITSTHKFDVDGSVFEIEKGRIIK